MNLGILVVYLVSADDAPLLDLHLRQIEKCTDVPYTIYASTNRLAPTLRSRLGQHPQIKIVDCPITELRNALENSFYLEQLAQAAIDDGATHIVTLHVDSFPIRPGWAAALAAKLSDAQPLAALTYGPYTACLFFRRDFYLNHQPRFMLSAAERASAAYQDFSARSKHVTHSGVGYLFRAHVAGLNWYSLGESQTANALGVVYADAIFHLHGNARIQTMTSNANGVRASRISPALRYGRTLVRKILPRAARRMLWENFGDSLSELDQSVLADTKQQMFRDPDKYFQTL